MAEVDLQLSWGDERLVASCHPLDTTLEPGGPFELMRPLELDGEDVLLTVPRRARAWVHTANGWRDLVTLRILGCVRPHPSVEGAAQVRMRRIADARGMQDGVALVRAVEARLEIEGWWLRVGLSGHAPRSPRLDRAAIRGAALFATFVVTLFVGVVSAFASVPSRQHALDLTRLEVTNPPRLPPVRVDGIDHTSERVETKHEVEPQPAGGPSLMDVDAPARPEPSRRAAGRRAGQREGQTGGETSGLERLAAAAAAMTSLGERTSPFDPGREARGPTRDMLAPTGVQRLATLRGTVGADLSSVRSASSAGPLPSGWGSGYGHRRVRPPRVPVPRVHALSYQIVPHCERRYRLPNGQWSCHPGFSVRELIRRVIRQHMPELRFCYEQGRLHQPDLEGRLTLRWTIEEDGSTSNVRIQESSLPNNVVAGCVRAAPEGWIFPGLGSRMEVSYPFLFRAL